MLYQNLNVRTIAIKKVEILKDQNNNKRAMVYFNATLRNIVSNQAVDENLVATINFQIDDVANALEKKAQTFNFLVLDYNVQKNNAK